MIINGDVCSSARASLFFCYQLIVALCFVFNGAFLCPLGAWNRQLHLIVTLTVHFIYTEGKRDHSASFPMLICHHNG